jgi:ribosome-binding factor A
MKRKPSRKILESLCGQPGPEDGLDPRIYFQPERQRRDDHKDRQVCRQVLETLSYVLPELGHDRLLENLLVCDVVPAPDATRLLVTVQPFDSKDPLDPTVILQCLKQVTGRLRTEVAKSISRRKVPDLVFRLKLDDKATSDAERGRE